MSTSVHQDREGPAVSPDRYEIVGREDVSPSTFSLEIRHPQLAKAAHAGQFVIVMTHPDGERIPLTLADFSEERGTITLVIQAVGKTTAWMQRHATVGTSLFALTGPMGNPSVVSGGKTVVCVGGGLGVAPIYPIARAFRQAGSRVIGVVGFRNRDLIFWQEKFASVCDELIICTDDGSAGIKGLVTDGLRDAIARNAVDEVIAIGPPVMMKFCAEATRQAGIPTVVSLNPIMVDGTGMCGGCRVSIGGETKFCCVDGPDFDGHRVDFDDLIHRLARYRPEERDALERWQAAELGEGAPA
jgi:NAD(P)H-flavin reductase